VASVRVHHIHHQHMFLYVLLRPWWGQVTVVHTYNPGY
jgi:hypothetical protein